MQLIRSELSSEKYRSSLKASFSSPFHFFNERFVGLCIGSIFYVIHHCEHQWDRKYNAPKNAAIGCISKCGNGCNITFISFKGLLCPSQFILLLSAVWLIPLLITILPGSFNDSENALILYRQPFFWIFSTLFTTISAGIHSLFESMTERSSEGEESLLALLYKPTYDKW